MDYPQSNTKPRKIVESIDPLLEIPRRKSAGAALTLAYNWHKTAMKIPKVFSDFGEITTQCELRRTLEFIIGRATYRVEVLYCYSNPKSPWVAQAYSENRSGWKSIPDFPWVSEKSEEAAIRAALGFLQGLH